MIEVRINGAPRRFPAALDVASLLSELEMAGKKVAVERNGEIVPKSAHARKLLDGHELVKLEVLGDPHTLYPNMPETLKAAEQLVKEDFKVMVYCSDDPIQAQMLEAAGCVAIMPLASLIGSGMGILNPWNLQLVIDKVKLPVLVDAGVGTASDAAVAMERGCDGVLMNTAVAAAKDPVLMAKAMKKAVEAGPEAFLAGRMPKKLYSAQPSSPAEGTISSKAA